MMNSFELFGRIKVLYDFAHYYQMFDAESILD